MYNYATAIEILESECHFIIFSFRNSPRHSAITEAFALFRSKSVLSLMCVGKLLPRQNCLNNIYTNF